MDKRFSDIEHNFIKWQLQNHGKYVLKIIRESIEELDLKDTGDLYSSLNYNVRANESRSEYVLEISFLGYGRAIEIQYFKSGRLRRELRADGRQPKYQRRDTRTKGQQSKDMRRAKRKDTRFYSKNVYGSINRLIGRLGSEYTEEIKNDIKNYLEKYPENK